MVRDRCLRKAERLVQLARAHRITARGEQVDDLDAVRVGEGAEEIRGALGFVVRDRRGAERRATRNRGHIDIHRYEYRSTNVDMSSVEHDELALLELAPQNVLGDVAVRAGDGVLERVEQLEHLGTRRALGEPGV